MQVRPLPVVLMLVAIGGSSLLGLTRAMTDDPVDGGWDLFGDVWQANFWGDAMFVLASLAAAATCAWLMRRGLARWADPAGRVLLFVLIVGIGLLLHWAAYAFAWSLTFRGYTDNLFDEEGDGGEVGFWQWKWDMLYEDPVLGLESAWTFTWCWGWGGLVFAALAVPAAVWLAQALRTGGPATARPTTP